MRIPGLSIDAMQARAADIAAVAALVAGGGPLADDAFSAGLLLDVGLLVVVAREPERLTRIVAQAKAEGRTLGEVERDGSEPSHAAVGAYLLNLWGLPSLVVEAVAFHESPGLIPSPTFDACAAAHIASALVQTLRPDALLGGAGLDALGASYLETVGVAHRIDGWLEAAAAMLGVD